MAGVPSQDPSVADDPWRKPIVQPRHPGSSSLSFESETPILDETIAIVTDKVWSFRSVLKAAAEALVGYGLNPQVVGYETVPVGDDEKLAEKDDGEAALRKVANDEILSRTSSADVSSKTSRQGRAWEQNRLVSREDYEDDTDHAFIESTRKDADERKSLARRTYADEDGEEGENVRRT